MNRLALVRAGYGLLQLASLPLSRGTDRPVMRRTVQVLGLRQLVQAAATAASPSPEVLALGVEVDLLHAASMVALAAVRRRYRRAALAEALAATALACAGTIAARRARFAPGLGSEPEARGFRRLDVGRRPGVSPYCN